MVLGFEDQLATLDNLDAGQRASNFSSQNISMPLTRIVVEAP